MTIIQHRSGAMSVRCLVFCVQSMLMHVPASHFHIFFAMAIPMGAIILNYRVYAMTSGRVPSTNDAVRKTHDYTPQAEPYVPTFFIQRRRAVMFDLALGIGIPVIDVILREYAACCDIS